MKIRFVLFLAIFPFFLISYGQAKPETEVYTMGFRISSIEKKGANQYKAIIQYETAIGVKLRNNASVFGKVRSEEKDHNHKLGTGVWIEVSQNQAVAEITAIDNEKIYVGDLLYTNITLPKKQRTSYFFLINDAISIENDSGVPYYTFKEVFEKDGFALRTQKFISMQNDIRSVGEKLKLSGDKTTVEAGPNAGKLVSEVMIQTDTMTVWYYVYHLGQMNWETMGQNIKLSENFRAYAKEGDAASYGLLKTLFVNVSIATMDENFKLYKRKVNKPLLDTWKDDAFQLRKDKEYEASEALLNSIIYLAEQLGNTYDVGVYYFSKGELYDKQGLYAKSVDAYQVALNHFEKEKTGFATAFAQNNLGVCYFKLGENEKALSILDLAINARTQLVKDNPENVDYLNNLYSSLEAKSSVAYAMKDFKKTAELYNRALTIAQRSKNRTDEGTMYWNLGYMYNEDIKDYNESLIGYGKAAEIYLELNDTSSAVTLRRSLAIVYNNLKNIPAAKKEVETGMALARKWGDATTLAYILEYKGLLSFDSRDYPVSIASYTEAEGLYKKFNNTKKLEAVKKKLAKSLQDANRYSEAIAKHQERFALIGPQDLAGKADAEWDIAFTYGKKKDHKSEILHYQVAEKLYTQLKDSANISTIINNIGYSYRDARDSVNSYRAHDRAIAFDEHRDKASLAYSYEHSANSYKEFRNFKKSIDRFRLAQRYYEEAGNLLKAANMVDDQAHRFADLKQYPQAAAAYKDAIAAYHRAGNKKEEAEAYWDYSFITGQNLYQYDEAIANYKIAYGLYMEVTDSVDASTMLSNIGQNYWSKTDYDKAIEAHQSAIALAKKCKNQQQVASSWSKLATLYKESNNPVAATNALSNAADALLTINDSTMLGSTYQDLANSYTRSKDYPKAIDFFNRSIAIRRSLRDTINWATAVYDLSGVYHTKNDFKNAEQLYLQSLTLRKKIKDKDGMMYTLVGLGNLEENVSNNYKKSEQYFLEAERLAKEAKNEYLLAYIYGQMKWLYRSQGKSALAASSVQKSLDLYKKNRNGKDAAATLVSMSYDASYVSGDQMKGVKLLDEAQLIADTIKDVMLQASIYGQRGSVLREMGEFQKALEYTNKSRDLYQQIDNDWGLAGVYVDRGNIYKQLSEYDEGVKNQQTADSLYRKIGAEYARLAPLANIGENYAAQGDYPKAMEYYQKSLAIMTKANDKNENLAIIQALMGEGNFYLGNYAEAEKWLKQSLLTCDQIGAMRPKADNLSIMGRLKVEEKKYDEARVYLTEGMKLAKEKSMPIAYLNNQVLMGKLEVEKKNYAAAQPLLEECIKTSRSLNKYNTLWESLYWQGVMHRENKELTQSRDDLIESVAVIEKIRNKVSGGEEARKLFSSDKNILKVYEVLVDVLLQLGETDLAMSYLQKNNEDNLKAKYRGLDIKFQNEDKNKVIGQERIMKAKLDGIEQQISNEKALPLTKQNVTKIKNLEGIQTIAEGDYLKFVNQQVNVQPELAKFFSNSVQPSEFRKRKKQIPKDMALLSYLPGENQLYIFMATTDTVIAKVVNVKREQLTRNVNGLMSIVRSQQGDFGKLDLANEDQERKELVTSIKQTDKMMMPFEELYHFLISPVAAEIANKKKLCIIPNGALSYIPFQLLGKTLQNGKFSLLANQFSIFYANSTDMLLRTLGGEEKTYNILAFGNPDKTLPSTEKEVSDIKKLFPNAEIHTRDDATEDKVKFAGENFNVMHFATHGSLDYEDFSKSYLTMAVDPSKNEDGKLTLEELWGMEVMNHLNIVVLSACQTAVTKGSNESSPVSPASGFLQNGVKSVVATLWKVDDEATSILIADFYKNIKTMEAVDALRTSQVNLSKNPKFSLPYYWAGAILLGDWR